MSNAGQNLSVDIKEDFKRDVEKSWEEKEGHFGFRHRVLIFSYASDFPDAAKEKRNTGFSVGIFPLSPN